MMLVSLVDSPPYRYGSHVSFLTGYYGYLSSQVYSTDMFYTVFKKNPMDPKEGRRYRHTVLERGGSQDEMQTLIDFLGREPKTDAFYEELGLTKGTHSGNTTG